MDKQQQAKAAGAFLARHQTRPILLLPNAWDAISARIFAAAGFEHLATTSAGVAWALGFPDGEQAPWKEVVAATARIVRAAAVPVTADIEQGYARTPRAVGRHVADIIGAGVVGLNLEDSQNGGLHPIEAATARLRAARDAADAADVPIVINARCDIFLLRHGEEKQRFEAAVERCKTYLAAGSDCVYPFGLSDPEQIAAFVRAVDGPVNITGRPGMPGVKALEQMGVARITIASAPTLVAMDTVRQLATDLRATGSFEGLCSSFHHPDAQKLFQIKG